MYIKYDKLILYLFLVRFNFSKLLNVIFIIMIYLRICLLFLMINYGNVMFKIYCGVKKYNVIFL